MCRWLIVRAETSGGKPYPGCEPVFFNMSSEFTVNKPTCTCYIGEKKGEGKVLRQTFVEECLQPFLEEVSFGKIIIEIR